MYGHSGFENREQRSLLHSRFSTCEIPVQSSTDQAAKSSSHWAAWFYAQLAHDFHPLRLTLGLRKWTWAVVESCANQSALQSAKWVPVLLLQSGFAFVAAGSLPKLKTRTALAATKKVERKSGLFGPAIGLNTPALVIVWNRLCIFEALGSWRRSLQCPFNYISCIMLYLYIYIAVIAVSKFQLCARCLSDSRSLRGYFHQLFGGGLLRLAYFMVQKGSDPFGTSSKSNDMMRCDAICTCAVKHSQTMSNSDWVFISRKHRIATSLIYLSLPVAAKRHCIYDTSQVGW